MSCVQSIVQDIHVFGTGVIGSMCERNCNPLSLRLADDPSCWSGADAALLEGTRAAMSTRGYQIGLSKLLRWRDRLMALQLEMGGAAPSQAAMQWALSREAVLWARSTVWSRAFNIWRSGAPYNLKAGGRSPRVRSTQDAAHAP